jgi:septal ring factor EnvC (AmiA/AmiB activator)
MIEWLMFGALGFFLGCLLALMLAPPFWNRAVKLTTRRLEATMPMSLNDIQADKDQLRAEFAIELRKVEVALDKAKEKAIRELIEANKRRVEIAVLNGDLAAAKSKLQENENANRVLQQTIKRRLPDLDSRLKSAKKALAELEAVNAELRTTVASQSDALKTARTTLHNQRADIERLRVALESGSGVAVRGLGKADAARAVAESQRLAAEMSKVQEELQRARTNAQENTLLRRELTRLASQILTVARAQGPVPAPQPRVAMTQVYTELTAVEEPQEPEPVRHESHAAHGGNGVAREPELAEPAHEVDSMAAGMSAATADAVEEPSPPEQMGEGEASEPKGLARRFAARREKRRARSKSSGKSASLSDRLKGLVVADQS